MLGIPALTALVHLGRVNSIAMPNMPSDARNYTEGMARHFSIPLVLVSKANIEADLIKWLKQYPCQVVVCLTFPFKIPERVLSVPPLGFINVHFAILPNYRGAEPMFWQIKNREAFGGITVHVMDKNWDTGPILMVRKVPINATDTHGVHASKVSVEAAAMVPGLLSIVDKGAPLSGQDQQGGKYFPKPVYADVKLDWAKQSSHQILATIKACNPWNKGAFTFVNGREVRIVEATLSNTFYNQPCGVPGSVLLAPDGMSFAVCCNDKHYIKPEIIYTDEGFFTPQSFIRLGVQSISLFH